MNFFTPGLTGPWRETLIGHFVSLILRSPDLTFIPYRENLLKFVSEPALHDDYTTIPWRENPKLGLLVQGPILSARDFTLETLSLYRKWLPNSPIVFSTWIGLSPADEERAERLGVTVVKSDASKIPQAATTVNLQIASTLAGLKVLQASGVDRVVKTRADQRICSPSAFVGLDSLLAAFPLDSGVTCQRNRLVVVSDNTFLTRLYGFSDFFVYGSLSDVWRYFDVGYEQRPSLTASGLTRREYAQQAAAELFLSVNYLMQCGHELKWSLADYWAVAAERFLVVDSDFLGLLWAKYSVFRYPLEMGDRDLKFTRLTFPMWLAMYSGNFPDSSLEVLLEKQ